MYRAIMRPYLLVAIGLIICVGFLVTPKIPTQARGDANFQSAPNHALPLAAGTARTSLAPGRILIAVDEIVASGFTQPVQATHAGDGSQRIFVVEQAGYIRVVKDGGVLPTAFLAIPDLVSCCGERGLLGLAFHPNYVSNGYFYVYYTRASDGASILARYSVSGDPDLADPNSAKILLTVLQPNTNHNGGQLAFGPDGYLYVGLGDGGGSGDPDDRAQDIDDLLGKILRIDVDGGDPYGIPPDNPYVGQDGADEVWALGLRNPWRFSFDRLTGDILIGDVGQNAWEEIDYLPAGTSGEINFGWNCLEGTHTYNTAPPCDDSGLLNTLIEPIAEYSHTEGRSVTGGFIYRGSQYPSLQGRYFFADYANGKIWSMVQSGSGVWSAATLELDTGFNISAFGEDQAGELYVVEYDGGNLRRLVASDLDNQVYLPQVIK